MSSETEEAFDAESVSADKSMSAYIATERAKRDFTRATEVTPEIEAEVHAAFQYWAWDKVKEGHGNAVRAALAQAVLVIIQHVPPCPDRSAAIRKIREARMDCNSAITHDGKY